MKRYQLWKYYIPLLLLAAIFFMLREQQLKKQEKVTEKSTKNKAFGGMSIGVKGNANARAEWEKRMLASPRTGEIPAGIRAKEIAFAKNISSERGISDADTLEWVARGPYDIGGRTRAIAIDVTDEERILSVGISGGVWLTEDGGDSWEKVSDPGEQQGATDIVQDPREGYTDNWYYSTGELAGNSAGDTGAYYIGTGIYKSTDGGLTWNLLENTGGSDPFQFETYLEGTWDMAVDPTAEGEGTIFVASYGRIYRSDNGGENWSTEINSINSVNGNLSYYTSVEVTSEGVLYAGLDSEGPQRGIWRSDDGMDWINILPDDFPEVYGRIVIGVSPSDENVVYFLCTTEEGYGKETFNFYDDPEWNALWRYNYISGDGSADGGEWTDLSANIPQGPFTFDDFNAQGGYNLICKVKPDDPNTVFIGGTNLYRSTDGFTSMDNTTFIGGYGETTEFPLFDLYENHHPDQHQLLFLPSDPNVVINANDGGLYRTSDVMADEVVWDSMNKGYLTTQFYSVAIYKDQPNNIIIGGLQDNGTRYTNSKEPDADWVMTFNYDGGFCGIPEGEDFYIMSIQQDGIVKVQTDYDGVMTNFQRIDPIGPSEEDYLFIHPFLLAPANTNTLFFPIGNELYINDDIAGIPYDAEFDSISTNWTLSPAEFEEDDYFTAIGASEDTENRVYLGTDNAKVYKVNAVMSDNPNVSDITGDEFPSGAYVVNIAVDPDEVNNLFVLFSNYDVYSMFYSQDGGGSWEKVAGNLETGITGTGSAPSFRWLEILAREDGTTAYFLGTSTGLYYTNEINGVDTEWERLDEEGIGASIVTMIESRELDDLIVVATHGNGIFSANTPAEDQPPVHLENLKEELKASLAPNPVGKKATLKFELRQAAPTEIVIVDQNGRVEMQLINENLKAGVHERRIRTSQLAPGTYYCQINAGGLQKTIAFMKL